jgi:hypothetical protein
MSAYRASHHLDANTTATGRISESIAGIGIETQRSASRGPWHDGIAERGIRWELEGLRDEHNGGKPFADE